MKKLLIGILVLVISLQFACSLSGKTKPLKIYPSIDIDMNLKQVSEHVYYVQGKAGIATDNKGFISNASVIFTDEGIVIFDALGSPSLSQKLVNEIRKKSSKPIKKVFISHYHADHFFGTQTFKDLGAEVIAPSGAMKYLSSEGADIRLNERRKSLKPWVNDKTYLVTPDKLVTADEEFSLGGIDFKITHFGSAHSHGDMSLYVKQDKVLLSGDIVFTGRIPFIGGDQIDNWIAKINELASVDADWVIPGHGTAFSNKQDGIKLTRDYLILMRDTMKTAISEMTPFDETYANTDWSQFENLPAFKTGNRINAYRVYLAIESQSF